MVRPGMVLAFALLLVACGAPEPTEQVLFRAPLEDADEILTRSGVEPQTAPDGTRSLKVTATAPTTVRIAEIQDPAVEEARLIYRARLRCEELEGQAYLEMWCVLPGRGEFFSRALDDPLSGTQDWVTQQTPFLLEKGQDPSLVKLNLVVEGVGTVWIDEVELAKAPLTP